MAESSFLRVVVNQVRVEPSRQAGAITIPEGQVFGETVERLPGEPGYKILMQNLNLVLLLPSCLISTLALMPEVHRLLNPPIKMEEGRGGCS